jgi:LysM repeat protein
MYKITVDDLKDANPGLTESSFSTGKTIKIPVFGGNPSGTGSYAAAPGTIRSDSGYKVQKGETLYSIGRPIIPL